MDNALDASPPGSVLTLRIHITDNHIQIIVRDQGSGIPKRSAVQNHHTVCYKQTGRHWIWAQF
ncbi:ATP-binding protein [Paenibacillus sp. JMULE4]|uniref:ATP-binding protein n=1 Tax=Paenibacillus sp. JMULE4 TaxID=2518342 RepID=UPI0028159E72|nr:ATP-binding protein [Paenibacillus sp. JMULE4]